MLICLKVRKEHFLVYCTTCTVHVKVQEFYVDNVF